MIKKIVLASFLSFSLAPAAFAEHITHPKKEANNFYVIAKGLYTIGADVEEEGGAVLKGKSGKGFGVDLGYTLPYHFSVELDLSHSQNDVENEHDEIETAKYWTYALDVVYVYHLTHEVRVIGKLGYEFEDEKIAEETLHENGMVYGGGVEYHLNDNYDLLVEYEGSTIDSARGDSIYAGVKYTF